MPSLKLLGAVLVVMATTELGLRMAGRVELTVRILTDLLFALQTLESEIAFAVNPLLPAAKRVAAEAKTTAVSECFTAFATGLARGEESTRHLWRSTVAQILGAYPIADKDLQIIERLGDQLGLSNREDQVKHIRQVRMAIEGSLGLAKERCQRLEGLYRKVGVSLGLVIVLLTW